LVIADDGTAGVVEIFISASPPWTFADDEAPDGPFVHPVRPVATLEQIPAVHAIPAKSAGFTQELLYDRTR
jgi:hypothetical protein